MDNIHKQRRQLWVPSICVMNQTLGHKVRSHELLQFARRRRDFAKAERIYPYEDCYDRLIRAEIKEKERCERSNNPKKRNRDSERNLEVWVQLSHILFDTPA